MLQSIGGETVIATLRAFVRQAETEVARGGGGEGVGESGGAGSKKEGVTMLGLGQNPLLLGALLLLSIVSGQSIVHQCAADAYRPQSLATTADGEIRALDNDASRWDVPHCEVAGKSVSCAVSGITFDRPANEAIVTPSGDNKALRASLRDGPPTRASCGGGC